MILNHFKFIYLFIYIHLHYEKAPNSCVGLHIVQTFSLCAYLFVEKILFPFKLCYTIYDVYSFLYILLLLQFTYIVIYAVQKIFQT